MQPFAEIAAMFSQVLASLSRLVPRSPAIVIEPADDRHDRDSGWHTSSYELAKGLEVVEIALDDAACGKPPLFADTQPAWYPPALPASAAA